MSKDTLIIDNQEEIKIEPNTVVIYPADELKELKKCLKLSGFQTQCQKVTGVSRVTIGKIASEKTGQYQKVSALRIYVKGFMEAMKK